MLKIAILIDLEKQTESKNMLNKGRINRAQSQHKKTQRTKSVQS